MPKIMAPVTRSLIVTGKASQRSQGQTFSKIRNAPFRRVFLPLLWAAQDACGCLRSAISLTPGLDYSSDVAWVWLVEMRQSTRGVTLPSGIDGSRGV